MTPTLRLTDLSVPGADPGADVLVVGPSLGTAVRPLWEACVRALGPDYRVIGWDLPGHGSSPAHDDALTVGDLAEALLVALRDAGLDTGTGARLRLAGVSLGGAVGLRLALAHGDAVDRVALICTGPVFGDPASWRERAALVRQSGTPVMVEGSAARWFAPGFLARDATTSTALLWSLQDADRESYAQCCEALATWDERAALGDLRVPLLAIAGSEDTVIPPAVAVALADAVPNGASAIVAGAAHLAPAEAPTAVAGLLDGFFTGGAHRGTT
jgi:3-oxoadipate enol-lactonase